MSSDQNSDTLPAVSFKEITSWINSVLDIDQLLKLIVNTANNIIHARAASLMLLNKQRNMLYFQIATGEIGKEVKRFELKVGEGIAGHVAQTGKPVLITALSDDPRWDTRISDHFGYEATSMACVPLRSVDSILGIIQVIDKEDGTTLTEDDLHTLMVLGELAAMAIVNARKIDKFRIENEGLKKQLDKNHSIIGQSPLLKKAVADGLKVANSHSSTLILGESGTGKEVLARLIHTASQRSEHPLISINCSAIPETLLESELFGHEKGAFTGAISRKVGKFELADGGSLFLDEIGEMPLVMQAKLLHILQEKVFYRVGGVVPVSVDVRIIAATNRDIEKEVAQGRFREDLYYRLNVVQIVLPSLRERKQDIPMLAAHFLAKFSKESGLQNLKITDDAMEQMIAYNWPGNIRELRNAIERAVVMGNGTEIVASDLPISSTAKAPTGMHVGLSLHDAMEQFKKDFIQTHLDFTGGNKTKAAKLMDIQRTYLSRLISRYKIQ